MSSPHPSIRVVRRSLLRLGAQRRPPHPVLQRRWGGPHPAFALLTSHEDQADALFLSIHLNFVPRALLFLNFAYLVVSQHRFCLRLAGLSQRGKLCLNSQLVFSVQVAKFGSTAPPDLYPEFGVYPGGGESPIIPFDDDKNAEREIIHGRWAMLGVTGAWAAENGTGIPWFTAGTLCTPDDCTAVADKFPGAVAPLAPEGSGYPSFWAVLAIEIFLVGSAECYRTGLFENPFPELELSVTPGGRFDPLGFAEAGDLEELKVKELKHCRLSMFAWLGCIFQALATQEGPIANWQAHVADPVHANVLTNAASGFGFY